MCVYIYINHIYIISKIIYNICKSINIFYLSMKVIERPERFSRRPVAEDCVLRKCWAAVVSVPFLNV